MGICIYWWILEVTLSISLPCLKPVIESGHDIQPFDRNRFGKGRKGSGLVYGTKDFMVEDVMSGGFCDVYFCHPPFP